VPPAGNTRPFCQRLSSVRLASFSEAQCEVAHTPARCLDHRLYDREALGSSQVRKLACTSERREPVYAGGDEVLDKRVQHMPLGPAGLQRAPEPPRLPYGVPLCNPAGRPKGSKNQYAERFWADLQAEWEIGGRAVIKRVMAEDSWLSRLTCFRKT
jgi:hypothetical protein